MTQIDRIIDYCKAFGTITPFQAFADLGITKLSTRVGEAEQTRAIKFRREWVETKNRYGEAVRFRKYSLEESNE